MTEEEREKKIDEMMLKAKDQLAHYPKRERGWANRLPKDEQPCCYFMAVARHGLFGYMPRAGDLIICPDCARRAKESIL